MKDEQFEVDSSAETRFPSNAAFKAGTALISYQKLRWALAEGESLSIGRRSTCDICIGSPDPGPEDLGVSRHAATLSHAQGRIWIRNDSTSLPVFVRPAIGQECVLESRGDMVSIAGSVIDVVLEGQIRAYRLTIELPETITPEDAAGPTTLAPETRAALPLKPRERRLLTALCEPLLTASGHEARPASYRQMADRLGLSDHTVRNALNALREQLLSVGIPGMIGPEAKDNLARYAVRSGSVTPADLELLQ
jgi:DNA-binding CsgD family transcriptional regulator